MAIMGIGGAASYYNSKTKPKEFNNSMDKDAFLNLLVTQLKNQNPLQPMEDKEFIAQMAQFSALEQAQNTNKAIKLDAASNLVNKFVKATYKNEETNESYEVLGQVGMVKVKNDKIYLEINNKDVLYDSITEITDAVDPIEQTVMLNYSFKLNSAFTIIGKEVKANQYNPTTKKYTEVSGVVEKVRSEKGKIFLTVNDKEILLEEVFEVK